MSEKKHSRERLDVKRNQGRWKLPEDTTTVTSGETLIKELDDQGRETLTIPPIEDRRTFRVGPSSDVLSRLEAFLPQISAANQVLASSEDASKYNMEDISPDAPQVIQMDLGLGVYEEKRPGEEEEEEEEEEEGDEEREEVTKLHLPSDHPLPGLSPSSKHSKVTAIQILEEDDPMAPGQETTTSGKATTAPAPSDDQSIMSGEKKRKKKGGERDPSSTS
ncbi:MAG: hypothetical protein DHS80DRAFT_32021 [Piptocephalis tieghemiana]|nr:MAG: hypothetical protein DHS80DRAFT_32021 [Piptocephalis tieghemiana]